MSDPLTDIDALAHAAAESAKLLMDLVADVPCDPTPDEAEDFADVIGEAAREAGDTADRLVAALSHACEAEGIA